MFSFSGKGSTLGCDFFPSIDLSRGEWEIGLTDLSTFNAIPNIEKDKNDKFHYGTAGDVVTIETGSYEIEDLETYIAERVKEKGVTFTLKPNNNTLQAKMKCNEPILFDKPNSIASLLGFDPRVYEANKTHVSQSEVNIIKVNVVRVECNIVRGSYDNGRESHVIHQFYPTVGPGFKIVEKPTTIIYLPVNVQSLSNVTIQLTDQDGNPVNLRDETVSLRLHMKQRYGSGI